jgi:DNA-binding MarR family transcriptional regulator
MKNERDKRAKFLDLAENRVYKAEKAIKLVGNLGNKNLYDSTPQERKEMKDHLKKALKKMEQRLDDMPENKKEGFKFKGK